MCTYGVDGHAFVGVAGWCAKCAPVLGLRVLLLFVVGVQVPVVSIVADCLLLFQPMHPCDRCSLVIHIV